ncbi:MAG: hypothetical protein ACHQ4J_10635 [Candidatus Binatia bacterium]
MGTRTARFGGSRQRSNVCIWWNVVSLAVALIALPVAATPRGVQAPRRRDSADAARPFSTEARGTDDGVGRPGSSCVVPRDVLNYHNGDLIKKADVFLLFWGAEWKTDAEHITTAQDVVNLYQQIGTTGYACAWQEYAVANQPIGPSTYHGFEVIPSEPESPLLDQTIQEQILAEVDAGRAPAPTDDTVYVVLPPRGIPVDLGGPCPPPPGGGSCPGGPTGCGGTNFAFCGYHLSFRRTPSDPVKFRYLVLPYPCNSGGFTCFVEATDDAGEALQRTGSHELSEVVTDPDVFTANGGWYSDRTGNEIADICQSIRCQTDVAAGQESVLVNSLWSNLGKGCVDSVPCAAPPVQCTDTSPGFCVPGRGAAGGCALEWLVYPNLTLKAANDLPGARVTCADGQPFCDADGAQDGQCTFQVAACLNSSDPRVSCNAAAVNSLKLSSPRPTSANAIDGMNAQTLLTALRSVDPNATGTVAGAVISYSPGAATQNACTGFFNVTVPVRASATGTLAGKRTISAQLQTSMGRATNRVTLVCNPSLP